MSIYTLFTCGRTQKQDYVHPPHIHTHTSTHTHTTDPSGEIHGGSITLPEASGVTPESASGSVPLESASGDVEPSSSGELPSTPDIVDWVDEYTVVVGTTLELPCHATGFPLPQVNWISRSIEVGREGEEEGVRVYPNGSLVISHIGGHHLQVYKCVAWNIHGITYRAVAVTIATGEQELYVQFVYRVQFSSFL